MKIVVYYIQHISLNKLIRLLLPVFFITLISVCRAQELDSDKIVSNNKVILENNVAKSIISYEEKYDLILERINTLEKDNIRLETQLNSFMDKVSLYSNIITIILGLGLLFSIGLVLYSEVKANRTERQLTKSSELAEERAVRAFDVAMKGEVSSQQRSSETHSSLLEGSQKTLNLVNDTLELAYDASKRASEAIQKKAQNMLAELDDECRELLDSVPGHKDRALIENPEKRSDLRSLAQRISGFEYNKFVVPEEIVLTARCLFIRGLDFHLMQQFKDAMKCWKKAAADSNAPNELKSLAWYWNGYEENNLGDFYSAERSFGKALETAMGLRKFELRRIELETRFFGLDEAKSPIHLINSLEQLLAEVSHIDASGEEAIVRKTKITVTLANILSQYGIQLRNQNKHAEAKQQFISALEYFSQVSEFDKWALFGKAEMLYELGEAQRASELFDNKIMIEVQNEAVRREEPRTKVLAKSTELICCIKGSSFHGNALNVLGEVLAELGRVDSRLTIYSQSRKRNVSRAMFESDLHELRTIAIKVQDIDNSSKPVEQDDDTIKSELPLDSKLDIE
jgi:tetratricopeptide (TPR) repeat protein